MDVVITKSTKKSKKQFDGSYIDLLPEDVVDKMFRDKHALEFRSTLNMIEKFSYAFSKDDELWRAKQPIRELLRPVAKARKYFYTDVEDHQGDMFFTNDVHRIRETEKNIISV